MGRSPSGSTGSNSSQNRSAPPREIPRAQEYRDPLPAALPRPDHERGEPRDVPDPEQDHLAPAAVPLRAGLPGVRDPRPCSRSTAAQTPGRSPPTTTPSTRNSTSGLRRNSTSSVSSSAVLRGLRDSQELQERGHRHQPQPRVLHGGDLRGLPGLQRHDGPHRGDHIAPAQEVHGGSTLTFAGHELDVTRPWRRLTMEEAVQEYAGIDVRAHTVDELRAFAREHDVEAARRPRPGVSSWRSSSSTS